MAKYTCFEAGHYVAILHDLSKADAWLCAKPGRAVVWEKDGRIGRMRCWHG